MKIKMKLVFLVVSLLATGCGPGEPKGIKITPEPVKPPPSPARQPMAIDPVLRDEAKSIIFDGLHASDPVIRANSVEAAQNALGTEASAEIVKAISDQDAVVRFAACMASGSLKIRDAYPELLQTMQSETDANVQVGVRFALHMLGDKRKSHDLEAFARHPDRHVRANTAMALGMLGEHSGLNVLLGMQNDLDSSVRLQVAEAMWRLGDEDGLKDLAEMSIGGYADEQIMSIIGMADAGDTRVIPHIRGKLASDPKRHDPPEIGLVAARLLGKLGSDEGYGVAMHGATMTDPRLKSLAALAFGAIGRSDAQPILSPMLKDPNQAVRIAAATGILELKA
jgi:HEAT repeat protein